MGLVECGSSDMTPTVIGLLVVAYIVSAIQMIWWFIDKDTKE